MAIATEVHQFHSGTAVGDAITNEMLAWRGHLRTLGFQSEIYAQHIDPGLVGTVLDIDRYSPSPGAVLLLHHSMGHDILDRVLDHPHLVVPVYHNITPLDFIEDPFYRKYAHIGQQQLRKLSGVAAAAIADSNYNRRQMLRAGFSIASVIPVKTEFTSLRREPDDVSASADWLFVGRVVPSKGQIELVDAFADSLEFADLGQSLVLIGDTSDRAYLAAIERRAIRRDMLDRVRLLGKVSDDQLAKEYRSAGIFVSMSKHEGFGVPLLEAMAAGIPVVAYAMAAVGETMGGAGVAVPGGDSVAFVQACVSLLTDTGLYQQTVAGQRQRLARLEAFDTAAALGAVVDEAAGGERRLAVQVQGPFETTYSLAILNRELALALDENPAFDVSIYATEGPGDYTPKPSDLAQNPAATALFEKSASVPTPDVVIRQMYPPRVNDSPGALTFQYFGWEESLLPDEYVVDFNRHLTGIGAMSSFVRDVLRSSGVNVPIDVVGVGVRQPDLVNAAHVDELADLRSFRFVHISSAFPRKGIDVLLKAYFSRFSGDDDVSLVLKTFPNPHNEVRAIFDQLVGTQVNPAHVVWIDRDMQMPEIDALYAAASVYVHPARGEGFGLPVAEAMMAQVPVIAPASTGLADFVDASTATTVPFEITIAQTHLSIPGSMWAEPDEMAVGQAMRSMYDKPGDPLVADRVVNARALIADQFSWRAVARRFADLIERERRLVSAPSIAMVSTWNSRCGIAEYSSDLVSTAADRWDTQILAERGVQPIEPSRDEFVSRTWVTHPHAPIDELLSDLDYSPAEIVHVQHNFGFFGLQQLADLIHRETGRRAVIVTLHRTEDLETPELEVRLADIASDLSIADRIIVHQHEDAGRLRALGIDRVEIIPIGARQPATIATTSARRTLGLQVPAEMSIIGTFGFLLPHKGTLQLIQAVGLMRDQGLKVGMIAVCALHSDPTSAAYEQTCLAEIERLGLGDSVRLVTEFLRPEVSHLLLSTADVIALPYHESAESSSAALRFVLPVGRPVVASDIGIFQDARESLLLVDAPPTPARLAATIVELLGNQEEQDEYSMKARHLAHESSIDRSVAEHSRLYRAVQTERAARKISVVK